MNNPPATHQNPMRQLFEFLGKYRKELWSASSASVINKLFDLMPPILTGWFIDTVSGNTPVWIGKVLGLSKISSIVIFLALLTFFIFAMESLFQWLFQRGFMRLAQKAQHDLRMDAYAKIQSRELAFFENQRIGNLMSILNDDVNQLERFLNTSFNDIIQLIVLFLFAGTSLIWVSPILGCLALLPVPFIIWGSVLYQGKINPHYKTVRQQVGELGNRLENNLSGIQVIKSFTAEDFELDRVAEASRAYREANFKTIRWNAVYVPLIRLVIAVGFISTLALAAWWVYLGTGDITLGTLALFAMMSQRLLWPVIRLGHIFNEYERAKASARRIFGILDSKNQLINNSNSRTPHQLSGQMEWKNVSFSYGDGPRVLQGIDLKINAGEMIGVVGLTGAGKTTLIKLLLRFYDLNDGEIVLDGKSMLDFDARAIRKQMGLVSQDVYLFHGTVRENICYGQEKMDETSMIAAAKKAALHDFIVSLPDGYDSIIGERGIKLSGGQRQRLSLARAILKNAPILILDEATSAIDTQTEKIIQHNLHELLKSKTAIVIAHRLSTIRHADQIIVIGDGKIKETGRHDELLRAKGEYNELWKVQTGELEV